MVTHGTIGMLNGGNCPGIFQADSAGTEGRTIGAQSETPADSEELCDYCQKKQHPFPGNGSTSFVSWVLLKRMRGQPSFCGHRWYAGPNTLACHHLLVGEVVNDIVDLVKALHRFGADMNDAWNGTILPSQLEIACHHHLPVHRGNHRKGWAYDVNKPMMFALEQRLQKIALAAKRGSYCECPGKLIEELKMLSIEVLDKIQDFTWTITADGRDYAADGIGCAGVQNIPQKRKQQPPQTCPQGRHHGMLRRDGQRHRLRPRFTGRLKPGE